MREKEKERVTNGRGGVSRHECGVIVHSDGDEFDAGGRRTWWWRWVRGDVARIGKRVRYDTGTTIHQNSKI